MLHLSYLCSRKSFGVRRISVFEYLYNYILYYEYYLICLKHGLLYNWTTIDTLKQQPFTTKQTDCKVNALTVQWSKQRLIRCGEERRMRCVEFTSCTIQPGKEEFLHRGAERSIIQALDVCARNSLILVCKGKSIVRCSNRLWHKE